MQYNYLISFAINIYSVWITEVCLPKLKIRSQFVIGEAQKFNALIYILPGEDSTFDSYEVTSLDPNGSLSLPNSGQLY